MNHKKLVLLIIFLLLTSIVSALDLSDYPNMFIEGSKFKGILAIADNAPAEDVMGISDIAMSLQYKSETTTSGTVTVKRIDVGATKLASEVTNPDAQNLILVGMQKRDADYGNPLIDRFYSGNPDGYLIKLIKNGDYYVLIATGDTTQNVREATRILTNYKNYNLEGMAFTVNGPEDIPEKEIIQKKTKAHLLVADNKAPSSDVIILTDVGLYLKQNNYEVESTKLTSEITKDMLDNRVTTFVYKGEAVIIVGENSPGEHTTLAQEISDFLKEEKGIKAKIIKSSEVKSDDLRELFPEKKTTNTDSEAGASAGGGSGVGAAVPSFSKDKDECASNSDCNDNNFCTSDICSGTPKRCSNTETSIGCNYNNKCVPIGVRIENKYCDLDKEIKDQKDKDEACNNNYECSTNVCVNNKCISQGLIQKMLNWLKKLFGG